MMLAELSIVMDGPHNADSVRRAVLVDNVLGKGTGAARRLALARLNTLYSVSEALPIYTGAI